MMPFEKRLARLEAARNMRFQGRQVGVIFDADEADNEARRKREESARFQKLARQSRAWQARCATALVVAEDRP
jgi:hypothetical protein